jgi:GNAT superfamily N-acetyltransferase
MRVKEQEIAGVTVRLASSAADLRAAARLLHDAYAARGYLPPEPGGMRLTAHLLLPTTLTFVAWARGQIVGTLSLFVDSAIGLPSEPLLELELERLRSRRRRVAEAGALAVAPGSRGFGVTYLLNKALYRCATELLGVDDLVIAVHPDAEDFYRAGLRFARLRPPRPYPGLGPKAQAVTMRLDLRSARWTWFQSFGHLPARADNPYHMYIERRDPQIVMPASVQEAINARRDGLADLLAIDPTPLAPLPRRVAAHLLALVGPAARVPDARVWEAAAFWDRPRRSTRGLRRPA